MIARLKTISLAAILAAILSLVALPLNAQNEIQIGLECGPFHIIGPEEQTWFLSPNHQVFIDNSYFYPDVAAGGFDHDWTALRGDLKHAGYQDGDLAILPHILSEDPDHPLRVWRVARATCRPCLINFRR